MPQIKTLRNQSSVNKNNITNSSIDDDDYLKDYKITNSHRINT